MLFLFDPAFPRSARPRPRGQGDESRPGPENPGRAGMPVQSSMAMDTGFDTKSKPPVKVKAKVRVWPM